MSGSEMKMYKTVAQNRRGIKTSGGIKHVNKKNVVEHKWTQT